jgi:hypothetical protein
MIEYSSYSSKWKMHRVVPYLMKFYFGNRPTSNKDLSEAFWKLMGKNVEKAGKKRWTTGKRGVPHQIHLLTPKFILTEVPSKAQNSAMEFPECIYSYVLGDHGQVEIDAFLAESPKHVIDREISKYLGEYQDSKKPEEESD